MSRFVETTKALLPEFVFGGQAKNMSEATIISPSKLTHFFAFFFGICALCTVSQYRFALGDFGFLGEKRNPHQAASS